MIRGIVTDAVPLRSDDDEPLPAAAEVVVIGGGVIGLSVAYHLAAAGVRDVVVLERDQLGRGSSAKPLGGVRETFSDPGNILLGRRSLDAYERFGAGIGLRQVGYLFLCRTEAEVAAVEASTALQRSLGGAGHLITPTEAVDRNPYLDGSALLAASFSPRDGYAAPRLVVAAYREAGYHAGVRFCEHADVLAVTHAAGAVTAVETSRGTVRTARVVCAAGAWSARIGAMVGVTLPVEPVRRQIGMTETGTRPDIPFTLDLSSTLYFHGHDSGLLLGISDPHEAPGFCREFSYDWLPAFNRAAATVAPALRHPQLRWGWAGLYENTPDHNALIGRAPALPGFVYATGFSGHGFLQAPAVGELVRDICLDRESFMDPAPFSADRFTTADLVREVHII